jgi:hypothetical protein
MDTTSNKCANALGNPAEMRYKSNIRSIERPFDTSQRSTSMSAMTIDLAPTEPRTQGGAPRSRIGTSADPRPVTRPGRGSARGRSPQARPGRSVPAPSIQTSPAAPVRGCVAERAVLAAGPTTWHLTDRGIAVVLVTVSMIVVAAMAVIGLTALRVTGDNYQGYGQSQSAQR